MKKGVKETDGIKREIKKKENGEAKNSFKLIKILNSFVTILTTIKK